MNFKAKDIAAFLNGEVIGNGDVEVTNVSKIEEGKPGTLAFLANIKYENYIYSTEASVVLVNKSFVPKKDINTTLIKVENAYQAFASLLDLYVQAKASVRTGIEQPSYVHETASVGDNIYIGAFAYIGRNTTVGANSKIHPQVHVGDNVSIGDNCIFYAGAKIYDDTVIGNNCIFHSGSVVGSDGFGFAPQKDGTFKKIHQIGNVIIEDDVEIGANTSIDCGTMESTIIRKGVKLDNLIQVGHNCEIGENTVIAAQTGISGSTKLGKNCMFGGQIGVAGHLKVGDHVSVGAQSGIAKNIKDKDIILGSPAIPIKDEMRAIAVYKNLPNIQTEVRQLRKDIQSLKNK
jgi:UDP-3-O-[3-hydroxymyristoyl] glucosamine N-acyltransferase